MATFQLTIKRGQRAPDVVKSSGSSISGSDAVQLNVDMTNMNKGELVVLIGEIKRQILEHGFPQ